MGLYYDTQSAIQVAFNKYQGSYKRVLCVCSAGVLRSATAAVVLSQEPYNFNTRCVGVEHYALTPVNDALLYWADEIVCMTAEHAEKIEYALYNTTVTPPKWPYEKNLGMTPILCLHIPDDYPYREAELIELIKDRYDKVRSNHKG